MGKLSEGAKEKLSERLSLPTSAIIGDPLIELTGSNQLRIENHKGIVKYAGNETKVNTSLGTLLVTGTSLVIKSMIPEEIVISGTIEKIEYLK
ncbi:MAG: sporulation protein YqfC [Eubacteriaceae bacterium]|jgi:sporulation protein YqfC|nr:sporulation protein YqfC [Eubacteriaceae bacterium]